MSARTIRFARFAAALAGALAPAVGLPLHVHAEPMVSARLSPSTVRVGEPAQLAVTVSGARSVPPPAVPHVDGLEVQGAGQQMSMRIVSGRTSVDVTHSFVVLPTRPGDFTIPSLEVEIEGRKLASEPVVLHAVAGAPSGGGAGLGGQPGAGLPAPRQQPPPDSDAAGVASLELALPRRELFVGELVRATLRLLVRDDVRVTEVTNPTFTGGAFTVTRDPKREPEQTETVIDGVRYHVVTFPVAVSPVVAGSQRLDAKIELQALLPRSGAGGRHGAFDDPFFDSFFGSFSAEPRKLPVATRPAEVRVLALPEEGRPPDFSGAIGTFTLTASAQPKGVTVGDPVTLEAVVSGRGNFDRVALAPLESSPDWKVYPQSSKLMPRDGLGLEGKKSFEQALVPRRADSRELPRQTFSYFDPEKRRYVTLSTEPLAIAIAPATRPAASASAPAGGTAAGRRAPGADAADGFELAPNRLEAGPLTRDLTPVALRPWFLAAQLAPVAVLAGGLLWLRRRERRAADPRWQRTRQAERAIRAQREEMGRALRSADAAAFFAAARRAVQESVAARDGSSAPALTIGEIESRLSGAPAGDGGQPALDDLGDDIRELFAAADAVAYGGGALPEAGFADWKRRVEDLLARLGGGR